MQTCFNVAKGNLGLPNGLHFLMAAGALIDRLELRPHPEGGWYREIYRSGEAVQTARGPRSAITSIYYLLESHQFSRWHVVDSDEIWHFYEGAPLELLTYDPRTCALARTVLGATKDDHKRVGVIPKDIWQAARSLGEFSLIGCNVGPGFDFKDFHFVAHLSAHRPHFEATLADFKSLL